jgi:hypothetical protein
MLDRHARDDRALRPTASRVAALITCGVLLAFPAAAEDGFTSLFDGRTTEGWIQRGGKAVYSVEDGALVGRTVLGEKNSFLCPPKDYADFVLEFEVLVDPELNSGVQIRSGSRPDYKGGVVHGYQVEIDPSERGWSGGIYEEQRRGWLTSRKDDPAASRAFKVGEWNHYKVEANGDQLRTWVNGVPVADLTDGVTRSGFIGFQVHQAKQAGLTVKWRNIRIQELPRAVTGLAPNTLTDLERSQGFELLFDGHGTWGWRGLKQETITDDRWRVADGVLAAVKPPPGEPERNDDIVTERAYSSFELRAEFRLSPGANSGIKYLVRTDVMADAGQSSVGLEYQIIDDASHPDARLGHAGDHTLAALYDVLPPPADKPTRPMGEWNEARIVARGKRVEHWLNGAKLLEFERGSEEFRRHVALSKHRVWAGYGDEPEGRILLQHHGGGVSFRNVKIRELKPE